MTIRSASFTHQTSWGCSTIRRKLSAILVLEAGIGKMHGGGEIVPTCARLARRWQADPDLVRPVSCRNNSALEYSPEHATLEAAASEERLGVLTPEPLEAVDQAFPS